MKRTKKVIASALTAAMTLSLAGGLGAGSITASAEEIPVVNFCMPNVFDTTDLPQIEEAINGITADKYGVKIKLTYVEIGNWVQQSNMLLTGDEADLIMVYNTPLLTYVKNGQLLALDDYYANASEEFKAAASEVFTEDDLKCTSVNGSLYALVNCRNHGDTIVLDIDETIAEEMGVTAGEFMTLDEVDELLGRIHEAHPERYTIVPQGSSNMSNGGWNWDGLGDIRFIGVIESGEEDFTVKNLLETEAFQELTSHTRFWYESGYMMQDCLSNTETGSSMIRNGKAATCFDNGAYYSELDFHNSGIVRVPITNAKADTTTISGMCWGINANSKNPDAAWKMMEVLYYDADVATLLANGIEGQNFVVNDDGSASYPEGKDQNTCGYGGMSEQFLFPNASLGYPYANQGADYYSNLAAYNASVQKTNAYGFCFDTSEVVDEYSVCVNIMDKYYQALMMGAVDPVEYIPKVTEELKAAGMDTIIAAKQEQFDAWRAEQ